MINIIGGTYYEIDYDSMTKEYFGSGLRAAKFLLENNTDVFFTTAGNDTINELLDTYKKNYNSFDFTCIKYNEEITFKYNFSLDEPDIYPDLTKISKTKAIDIDADNIIAFGMIESDLKIKGNKILFDPQTSINPKAFSSFGNAKELIYVVNKGEAIAMANSSNMNNIRDYFFIQERAIAFIIKDGPFGATLHTKKKEFYIPAYKSNNVFKIGSGDIFTSSFGYYWIEKGLSLEESAINASKSTALFCDSEAYLDTITYPEFNFKELKDVSIENKQVYLASPFFSLSELVLIDKIRSVFMSFGVKVFSPFHDVGLGNDLDIAVKDYNGIDKSDIIFLVLDNYDSGTLIEAGYSFVKDKKMIGYHRTCEVGKLLMLKPANIKLFNHLTTAIYQTIWNL